jgi:hypothetical protein
MRDVSDMSQVRLFCFFLTLLAVDSTSFAGEAGLPMQPGNTFEFQPYIHCDGFAGGVRGVTLDRRPPNATPWREVSFGGRTERVSVVDGYRVTYSYPRTYPFANLKAERSDPSRYDEDKRIVTENFVAIAKADGNVALESFSDRGFWGQTLTKKKLGGRTLGITQIFLDEDSVVVTIFFLNQAPENRRFETYDEFISLRDRFVRGYIECVAKKRSSAVPSEKR